MKNVFDQIEPKEALAYFSLICSIPHPSGEERKLAETIINLAAEKGLQAKMDPSGNVRIDRPAAKGMENSPLIILQGHLDMVPKAAPGKKFDFSKEPLELIVEDGIVRANGTTLGADNGAGCASALACLFDPELKAGPLAGLFTVGEEVGLIGANALAPEMLAGDWLFNLDSGAYHDFCIGCAGGARLSFSFPMTRSGAVPDSAFTVKLSGLTGGHSGTRIHERYGNALILLAKFLQTVPELALISFEGGSADNAIPSEAEAVIAAGISATELQNLAEQFRLESSGWFHAPAAYEISITPSECPETAMAPDFAKRFLNLVSTVPNEVFSYDESLNIVKTSSNFASVQTLENRLEVRTSQRSLDDSDRETATRRIMDHFSELGGSSEVDGVYPGWPADPESEPVKMASVSYEKMFGRKPGIYAIHAGLETGAFAKTNPALKILSFGPEENEIHTERESLDLQKYAEFNKLLRFIIEQTTQKG